MTDYSEAHPLGADTGPIQPELHALMNALASGLDAIFNGEGCAPEDKRIGFFLAAFAMGAPGRFNYISNCDKLDVRAMLKDIMARIEARLSETGHA